MWVVDNEGGYTDVTRDASAGDARQTAPRVLVRSYVREDLQRVVDRSEEDAEVTPLDSGTLGWTAVMSAEGYLRSLSVAVTSLLEPRNLSLPRYADSESVESHVRERSLQRATDALVMLRYGDVPPTSMAEILRVRGDLDVLETTAGEVKQDPTLVEPGDLVEFTFVQTGGQPVHRSLVKVAQVRCDGYLEICGHWTTRHFHSDGAEGRLEIHYGSFSAASWDPVRVLKGGAPEIFDGEGMDRLRATIAAFETGIADFEDLNEAVGRTVFAVGTRAPQSEAEAYEFVGQERSEATFDRLIWPLEFRKLITHDQWRRLHSLARFTNGRSGRSYEGESAAPDPSTAQEG